MEQRKVKLLQVHGKAIERDLAARKGVPRHQVRDMLDAASAATVVRNVKRWVGKNRSSMAALKLPKSRSAKPAKPELKPGYAEIISVNNKKLRDLSRRIRQNEPGSSQLRYKRRLLQIKIAGLRSEGTVKR